MVFQSPKIDNRRQAETVSWSVEHDDEVENPFIYELVAKFGPNGIFRTQGNIQKMEVYDSEAIKVSCNKDGENTEIILLMDKYMSFEDCPYKGCETPQQFVSLCNKLLCQQTEHELQAEFGLENSASDSTGDMFTGENGAGDQLESTPTTSIARRKRARNSYIHRGKEEKKARLDLTGAESGLFISEASEFQKPTKKLSEKERLGMLDKDLGRLFLGEMIVTLSNLQDPERRYKDRRLNDAHTEKIAKAIMETPTVVQGDQPLCVVLDTDREEWSRSDKNAEKFEGMIVGGNHRKAARILVKTNHPTFEKDFNVDLDHPIASCYAGKEMNPSLLRRLAMLHNMTNIGSVETPFSDKAESIRLQIFYLTGTDPQKILEETPKPPPRWKDEIMEMIAKKGQTRGAIEPACQLALQPPEVYAKTMELIRIFEKDPKTKSAGQPFSQKLQGLSSVHRLKILNEGLKTFEEEKDKEKQEGSKINYRNILDRLKESTDLLKGRNEVIEAMCDDLHCESFKKLQKEYPKHAVFREIDRLVAAKKKGKKKGLEEKKKETEIPQEWKNWFEQAKAWKIRELEMAAAKKNGKEEERKKSYPATVLSNENTSALLLKGNVSEDRRTKITLSSELFLGSFGGFQLFVLNIEGMVTAEIEGALNLFTQVKSAFGFNIVLFGPEDQLKAVIPLLKNIKMTKTYECFADVKRFREFHDLTLRNTLEPFILAIWSNSQFKKLSTTNGDYSKYNQRQSTTFQAASDYNLAVQLVNIYCAENGWVFHAPRKTENFALAALESGRNSFGLVYDAVKYKETIMEDSNNMLNAEVKLCSFQNPLCRAKRLQKNKETLLKEAILDRIHCGLKIEPFIPGKGRGIVTTKNFSQGDFVVEYSGDLITAEEAEKREEEYEQDNSIGSYMYYFKYRKKNYCIDATAETENLGRLINHSAKKQRINLLPKVIEVNGKPHLYFTAARDLKPGEELLYDYGEKEKEAVFWNPWLRST